MNQEEISAIRKLDSILENVVRATQVINQNPTMKAKIRINLARMHHLSESRRNIIMEWCKSRNVELVFYMKDQDFEIEVR